MSELRLIMLSVLQWIVYPLSLLLSIASFYWAHLFGCSWGLSALLSSFLSVAVVMLLERILPYEREWKPDTSEIRDDIVFMVLVQLVLPKVLALSFSVTVLRYVQEQGWEISWLWPHSLPALAQVIVMMVIADFFRYWLHRLSHENHFLWRFHAVHHSPHKLYWLNVGRFHPIDKAAQYLCDSLPFILLGVSEEVLTLYFAFYAIKGFFQHSNIDAKLGYLNYIFSGPELHRWHHSKFIRESNTNYGNNLIIWDLAFGTYFRPEERKVSTLGLLNRSYPMGFWEQMKAPFVKGLDKPPTNP